ncbi:MAG: tRNA guanosine(34) transglycosylase Tgt [Patescibacteria group bacterium]|nr:tRNA guanosine(34) transglycosylase Tgt [Patescibacteria group bacterium]
MKPSFEIIKKDKKSKARAGIISTPHGEIETPIFIPVGTNSSVKSVNPRDLKEMGAQIILANTYHLHLRPGESLIKKFGGLSKWMSWGKPTMTDSGGFQVFSLGVGLEHGVGKLLREEEGVAKPRLNKITQEGVTFQSHIDGSKQFLSPETSIEIQEKLGADLIVAFDDLESPKYSHEETENSLLLTEKWLIRSIKAHKRKDQLLYGVTHGGSFKDLREKSARFVDKHFNAIALGGAHKNKQNMHDIVDWTIESISEDKPRHMLGIGEVDDIFELIERGIDTFDCVIPTRIGRTGFFFVSPKVGNLKNRFRMDINKPQFRIDAKPLDENCTCYTCKNFTRAYLHHLFRSRELLVYSLISTHNVHFLVNLTKQIRNAILEDKFNTLKMQWLDK